jgi:hypothetical protein
MEIDTEKIDEAVLYLTLHDGTRAWKGLDWDTMNRFMGRASSRTLLARRNLDRQEGDARSL